jgi:hypothetical protein
MDAAAQTGETQMSQTIEDALGLIAKGDAPSAAQALTEAGIPARVNYADMGIAIRYHEPNEPSWAYTVGVYAECGVLSLEIHARILFGEPDVARRLRDLAARIERGELVLKP